MYTHKESYRIMNYVFMDDLKCSIICITPSSFVSYSVMEAFKIQLYFLKMNVKHCPIIYPLILISMY